MTARVAESESRKLSLPQSPDAYKAELPPDFKLPEGKEYTIDPASPVLAAARKLAHETGADQTTFSQWLGLWAGAQMQSDQMRVDRYNAEVNKLGSAGAARIDAVNTWLDAKGYSAFKDGLVHAEAVQAVEKMMRDFSSQGAASFSTGGRDAEAGGRVSDEVYNKMSDREKRDYARRFDQKQFQTTNGAGR